MAHRNRKRADQSEPGLFWTAVAFSAILLLFLVASYFPEQRLWGVSIWGYFAGFWRWLLFGTGLVALFLVIRWPIRSPADQGDTEPGRMSGALYVALSAGLLLVCGVLFYLLRTQTHFLGDGYLQLARLTEAQPLMKARDFGEELLHIWTRDSVGGEPGAAAQMSYRILSIASGLCVVVMSAVFARQWFRQGTAGWLLLGGLLSGGYMLLFFGYIENYSLFVTAVGLFAMVGTLAAGGKLGRGWIVLPLALAIFLHILGTTLIPAALYLLLRPTAAGRHFAAQTPSRRWLTGLGAVVVAFVVLSYFWRQSYFFRFALLPLLPDRFTVAGYTLISASHVADCVNLVLILVPAAPLLAIAAATLKGAGVRHRPEHLFLLILSLSTLGAAFIFDPKLGMPRDWDLFAFSGVPLSLLLYLVVLDGDRHRSKRVRIGLLSVALGIASLLPRAVAWHTPAIGETIALDYVHLDLRKSRTCMVTLSSYFLERGDTARYRQMEALRESTYPERRLALQAQRLFEQGRAREAMPLARRVVRLAPREDAGWLHLGRCFLVARMFDSAVHAMRIAEGLNPDGFLPQVELARVYLEAGDYPATERASRKAIGIDATHYHPYLMLAQMYRRTERMQEYGDYLRMASKTPDAPCWVWQELGDYHLNQREMDSAGPSYRRALELGCDSAVIREIIAAHPELEPLLRPSHTEGDLSHAGQ